MVQRRHIFRIIRKSIIILVPVWLLMWIVAGLAAPRVLELILPKIQAKAKRMGVDIDHVKYDTIKVSPWLNAVTAEKVSVDFDMAPYKKHRLSSTFHAEKIHVKLADLFSLRGSIHLDDFDVNFHESDLPESLPFDRFTDGNVKLGDMPLFSPREAVRKMLTGVIDLFDDNTAKGEFEFSGTVQIKLGPKILPARIYTERKGEAFRLRFSEDDVRAAAKEMHMKLADDQVEMVSYYPLRIPLIAIISERANNISIRYYGSDHWKQDALRHTMWSFMLTNAFGPDFAKVVTHAQESKPGNTHDERLMDYNNNAVGRALVSEGVKLQQIPRIILDDPRVILSPQDVSSRPEGELLK